MKNGSNRLHVLRAILTFQPKDCPYCGCRETTKIGSNSTLSHIRKCSRCQLMYRWPTQDQQFNQSFYQKNYAKLHHSTATDLPDPATLFERLPELLRQGNRDFSHFIAMMKALGVGSVLDYGCSWGYGAYQFQNAGLDAMGFEISKPRVDFGVKHLQVRLCESIDEVRHNGRTFDAVFCSHVIEHLPSPRPALENFRDLVRAGGWLIVAVPNCGGVAARTMKEKWGPFSSSIHPQSYTADFFRQALPEHGFVDLHFLSEPYDIPDVIHKLHDTVDDGASPDGDELLVIARRKA